MNALEKAGNVNNTPAKVLFDIDKKIQKRQNPFIQFIPVRDSSVV